MSLHDDLTIDPDVSVLYASSQIALGEFHAGPEDPRWAHENCASEGLITRSAHTKAPMAKTSATSQVMP